MTARPGRPQVRFTAGELDELLWQNNDLKLYDKGAQRFENVVNLPQGGFTLRDGTRMISYVRRPLIELSLSPGFTASAPAGGTAANAVDGDPGTSLVTNPFSAPDTLVFELTNIDLTVCAVDISAFGANIDGQAPPTWQAPPVPSGIFGALVVHILTDAGWQQIYGNKAIHDTLRVRRLPLRPGSHVRIYGVRVYVTSNLPNTVFRFAMMRFFAEQNTVGPVRIRSFKKSIDESYDFVMTGLNVDVIVQAGWIDGIFVPYVPDHIARVGIAQKLDTMLLFSVDQAPQIISNQGAAWEWNVRDVIWRNIPDYDYGASYTNGTPAEWTIQFFNFDVALSPSFPMPAGGASCVLTVNGSDTIAIQIDPTYVTGASAVLAPKIKAAIEALPGVSPGLVVVQDPADFKRYKITFSGAGNEGDGWAVAGKSINKGDAAVTAARTVAGVVGGEPIMSPSRGWPRCGVFYQQRLLLGGFKGVPNAVLASQEGDPYQLDTRLSSATAPMLIPIDTEGAEAILHIIKTRALTFFTSEAEHWLQGNVLARTQTPVIVEASRNGASDLVRPVASGNSSQYMHRARGTLLDFKFDLSEQNYLSKPISTSASSLIDDITDMSVRTFRGDTDVNRLFMVREDGQGVIASLLQEQEIIAFARMTTRGQLEAVNVNGRLETTWIARRTVAGQTRQFVERMEQGLLFDQAITQVFAPAQRHITGLADFEGEEIWIEADREIYGPFIVSGGAVDLPVPATNVTAGRWSPPLVITLPPRRDIAPGTVKMGPARVHSVRLFVVDTTSVAISANGRPLQDVPLVRLGQLADVPMLDRPYTGQILVDGLDSEFNEFDPKSDGTVTISQLRPGRLTVTAIIPEIDL
ncbi:MAG TPA: hypothetical protein VGU72_04310 [Beijerinckiaceae bacterium]|jgi:hypothetical protein|nr:hypothetical protein [Beijerinckiaceae bacterium]